MNTNIAHQRPALSPGLASLGAKESITKAVQLIIGSLVSSHPYPGHACLLRVLVIPLTIVISQVSDHEAA